jgi:hypothetical protein
MNVNGSNGMMGPRMSTNLSVERQTTNTSFGARVNAGLNNVAGAVSGGLGTVANLVPGGSVVSAAVSSTNLLGNTATPGAGSQYNALASGVSSINTNVGGGAPGFVGGAGGAGGSPAQAGINLASSTGAAGGASSVANTIGGDPTLTAMFAEQKKLLTLQASVQQEAQCFTAISNVMKTRHDTIKNSISNVR